MALHTHLTRPDIEAILANFAIHRLSSYKTLSGGSENSNYLIVADGSKYVLTISEQKSEEKARELAILLEYLASRNFKTSKVIRNSGDEPISFWKGKPIMLKEFVEGKVLKELPLHVMELLGRQLGKLHHIDAPEYLPTQVNYGKEQFVKVENYAANSAFDLWLREKLEYVSSFFDPDLPKSLIHSDVFSDNLVIAENEKSLAVMDFEEAVSYYRIFDLGMAIVGTCAEGEAINIEKVRSLMKGYHQEIKLMDMEKKALQAFTAYAGASMTFWRHYNFNYVKPDPGYSNHYLELKILTDNICKEPSGTFLAYLK